MANLQTNNIGANWKGILNLGSTINTPLSTTLQAITDGNGVASPLQLATNRIALGTSTGTSLLNFPDAGTTATDGISFGTGTSNLYRSSSNWIKTDGNFSIVGSTYLANTGHQFSTTAYNMYPLGLVGSANTSALTISQTHNTTGSPDVIKIDIVNTASGANTRYINFYNTGTSQFSIDRLGNLYYLNNGSITHSSGTFTMNHGGVQYFRANNTGINIGTGGLVASAKLSVESTTQGFLPPRMTTAQKNAISSPATGLMVYDTTLGKLCVFTTVWETITSL